jgi:O-antigen/teichoic acid export membrane protein
MQFVRKIAANTFFQIIARIASSASSFLITIIIAKHFGISGYGDFAKVTAFVSLFYLLVDFGFNPVFLQKEDAKVRFKELFYIRLLLAAVLICVINSINILLPFNAIRGIGFSQEVKLGITIFSFTLIPEAILYTATVIFQRELIYKYFMIASIIGSMVTILFVLISTTISYSLFFVFFSFIAGGMIESILALFFTKEAIMPFRIDVAFARKLTVEALPITLMLFFNLIYFHVDILLLAMLKPSRDVAIYDLAYKFFDFLIALPLFLSNTLYPSILDEQKNNRNPFGKNKYYIAVFILFSFFVLIPTWILAPLMQFIKIDFLAAVIPLRILIAFLPVFFVTSILQWILIAKKQQIFLSGIYFISTIINILLNLVFIPQFSYIASAVITGISEFFVLIALLLQMSLLKNKKMHV